MEDFKSKLTNIHNSLSNLEAYTRKMQLKIREKKTTVTSADEELKLNNEIKAIEQIFKETSNNVRDELKKMHEETEKMKNEYNRESTFVYETRNSHWQALTNRLRNILTEFRSVQVSSRNVEEQKAISQVLIENPEMSMEAAKKKIRSRDDHLGNAEERHKRVMQIVEYINELCVLIDELHEMVKSQRGVIDKIEVKMAGSVTATEKAKKSLQNALSYQISATRLKRIIFLIVFLILLVLGGIVVWKLWPKKEKGGGESQNQSANRFSYIP